MTEDFNKLDFFIGSDKIDEIIKAIKRGHLPALRGYFMTQGQHDRILKELNHSRDNFKNENLWRYRQELKKRVNQW